MPDGYNLQSLIEEHSSYARNKLIANAFYLAGFIENWGRGIEKVQEEFAAANLPIPTFETNSGGVVVTIPRGNVTKRITQTTPDNDVTGNEMEEFGITKNVTKSDTKNDTKNDTKSDTKTTPITLSGVALKVVRMIKKNPNVTTEQMAKAVGGITKKNLIILTNNLQRDGIIRHVGPSRGGHWEVITTK